MNSEWWAEKAASLHDEWTEQKNLATENPHLGKRGNTKNITFATQSHKTGTQAVSQLIDLNAKATGPRPPDQTLPGQASPGLRL